VVEAPFFRLRGGINYTTNTSIIELKLHFEL